MNRGGAPRLRRHTEGFALAVVIFLLFAVGMAAAAGYAVVALEADMAGQAGEGARALSVARAGMERYLGEHLGVPRDSTIYAVAGGTAVVRARRIASLDPVRGLDLYVMESEGRVLDPVNPLSPARRSVTQYARLHTHPVGRHAAAVLSYQTVRIRGDWGQIRGNDHSTYGKCPESGSEGLAGMVHRGSTLLGDHWDSLSISLGSSPPPWGENGALVGIGRAARSFGDHRTIFNAVGLRWDVLTDPAFPIPYDGFQPPWATLAATEYPVVRYQGDLSAGVGWSGRGVLIVTGDITLGGGFLWDGIVLAGGLRDSDGMFWVRGMLIAGLNGGGSSVTLEGYPHIFYDVCSALAASRSLAYLEPLPETWWEVR